MQQAEIVVGLVSESKDLTQVERNEAAIELLRSWREEGDVDEQRETGAYLIRVLAEDHIVIGENRHGDPA